MSDGLLIKKYIFRGLKSLIDDTCYNSHLNIRVIHKVGNWLFLFIARKCQYPLTLVIDRVTITNIATVERYNQTAGGGIPSIINQTDSRCKQWKSLPALTDISAFMRVS